METHIHGFGPFRLNTRLRASLHMHDIIHGFRVVRGTVAAIMELKLAQDLARIYQDTLLLVFLDLRKAYDTVDRERLLITLEGYGACPRLCEILENFWDCQQVVPRHNGFHGLAFPAKRGTILEGLVSRALFNMVVDNFIRTWLAITVEEHRVARGKMGETIGRCVGV